MEFDVWITFSRNLSRLPHKLRADEHPKPFTRAVSAAVARREVEGRTDGAHLPPLGYGLLR